MLARHMLGCVFVHLSVTSRHCTKTAKRSIMQTMLHDSPGTSFLMPKISCEIPTGSYPCAGAR